MSAKEIRFDPADAWPERGVSILNGIVGDYLQKRGNDLAIAMSFRHQGQPLELTEAGLRAAHASLSGKLCILVHGFCCNESVWTFPGSATPGSSYGTRLQRDLGYTPFYVRYNTGLPIAQSGAQLANLLDELVAAYPRPVEEITLIGHSMGGLLMRSACDLSRHGTDQWLSSVKRAIYIGTPHDGADLERFAHLTTGVLQAIPTHVTRLIGDILNLRSRGVKDLASGRLSSPDGSEPWLPSARHYLLMGILTKDPEHPVGQIFGDALVRVPRTANLPEGNESSPEIIVFPGIHHLALAHDESIYRCIRQLCAGE
ncbi:MAG: alpha/beta fold hydrolase [Betaproteobacteria bacterium]